MSSEANRYVWENSRHRGPHLLALLALAHNSKARHDPWTSEIGFDPLRKLCRLSPRRMKAIVADLVESGDIKVIVAGGGALTNIYQLFLKYPTPVLKAEGVPVLKLAPVNREKPQERASRARFTSKVLEIPKAKKATG